MAIEDVPEIPHVKAPLNRLAGQIVIMRAIAAAVDLDAAAEFLQTIGVDQLELAVAATKDSALEVHGRRALDAFQQFRWAARDDLESFNRYWGDRGSDLRIGPESGSR